MRTALGYLRSFGRFWWQFIVGDTPEMACATLAIVVAAIVLADHRVLAIVVLPLLAVAALVASVYRGRIRRPAPPADPRAATTDPST